MRPLVSLILLFAASLAPAAPGKKVLLRVAHLSDVHLGSPLELAGVTDKDQGPRRRLLRAVAEIAAKKSGAPDA